MPKSVHSFALVTLVLVTCACSSSKSDSSRASDRPATRTLDAPTDYEGALSQPTAAQVDLSDNTLGKFDDSKVGVLFRYLAGNPRWEIREERGLRYAIRKEQQGGVYQTTLNGFYSSLNGQIMHQTRVLISFGKPYGFGMEHGNVTRAVTGSDATKITIEGDHAGTPGNSSYLIVDGGAVFLEIYDQAPEVKRQFTQGAFSEVSAELRDVLANLQAIEAQGIMPVPSRYPVALPSEQKFEVSDGMQLGIYNVAAAVANRAAGKAFLKVFRVDTGARLSEDRVLAKTTRHMGWSSKGKLFFPYSSEVTIYEGDWSSSYPARFELWLDSADGPEVKLAETTRSIHGWQH